MGRLPGLRNIRRVGRSFVEKKTRSRPLRPIRMLTSNELATKWPACILTTYVPFAPVAAPHSTFERVRRGVTDVQYHSLRDAGGVADGHARR